MRTRREPFFRSYRVDLLYVGGLMLLTACLLGLMLNRFLTVVNHDSAIFCILAQSILKGHYLLVSEPNPQPYFTFPPLLPLQLAGLMRLFGTTDTAAMQPVFKGYVDLLFVLSLPLFYAWIRQMGERKDAMIVTALLAVNPILFKYSSDVLSDTPYWAFSMAALYAGWRFQQASSTHSSDYQRAWGWFALTVTLIIACALTRQIGIALIVAFLTVLFAKKQWRQGLIAALLCVGLVGGWQSYEHFYRLHHRSDISSLNQQGVQAVLDQSPIKLEYVKHFLVDRPVDLDQNRLQNSPAVLLQNIAERVVAYTHISLDQLLPDVKLKIHGQKRNLTHLAGWMLLFGALLAVGFRRLFQQFPFGAIYLGVYGAVLLVYPYISPRFLLPVFPIIALCVYWGLQKLSRWLLQRFSTLPRRTPEAFSALFLLLALAGHLPDTLRWVNAGYQLKIANQGPSLRAGNRAYYQTLLWLKGHTPPDSLIISRKPPVTYFYSGRVSTAFPFTAHTDQVFAYIDQKRADARPIYIFEDHVFGSSTRYLQPTVERYRDRLSLVYTEPTTHSRVWRLKPPAVAPSKK